MRDAFFSYSVKDGDAVRLVAESIRSRQLDLFVDRWYLVPGQPWPQALEEALTDCRSVVAFLGPTGLGPWQQREIYLALDRQAHDPEFRVVPVLLPGGDPPAGLFLSLFTWVNLSADLGDARQLDILAGAIRGQPPDAAARGAIATTKETVCPFRGLKPFREEDAAFFFGRAAFVDQLVSKVTTNQFVGVIGPSGCGKSSVVRAGLVPKLRDLHSRVRSAVWDVRTMVPGSRPLHQFADALVPMLEPEAADERRGDVVNEVVSQLRSGQLGVRGLVSRALSKQAGTDHLLLVVDQWEEFYTLCTDDCVRRLLIDGLLDATGEDGPLTVVFTARADFFDRILDYRPLGSRLQDQIVNVGPLTVAEMRESIVERARLTGLTLEKGLTEAILEEGRGEPGTLPLIEFLLTDLWERRRGTLLTHEAYHAIGGLKSAVPGRAEKVYRGLTPEAQAGMHRLFVNSLVQLSPGVGACRRRASASEIGVDGWRIVQNLANERLVVVGSDETAGGETAEVAHETLIHNWERLTDWVRSSREFLLWRARLETALKEHGRTGGDAATLLRGPPLAEAANWLAQRADDISALQAAFIRDSRAAAEAESREKDAQRTRELELAQSLARTEAAASERLRRRARQLGVAVMASAAFGVVLVFVAAWASSETVLATRAAQAAKVALHITIARADAAHHLQESLRRAIVILKSDKAPSILSDPNIAQAADVARLVLDRIGGYPLTGHQRAVTNFALSPAGRWLATGGPGGIVDLWDLHDFPLPPRMPREYRMAGDVADLAFSGDGSRLAAATANGAGLLALGPDGPASAFTTLGPRGAAFEKVRFDARGGSLALVRTTGTVDVWDLQAARGATVSALLEGHTGRVNDLLFGPDGKHLVTAGEDGSVRIWELGAARSVSTISVLRADSGAVFQLTMAGAWLAARSARDGVQLWSLPTGATVAARAGPRLRGHSGGTVAMQVSPSGRWLATGGADGVTRIWDMAAPDPSLQSRPLRLHLRTAWCLAFSPDERWLATGSPDMRVGLWDLASPDSEHPAAVMRHPSWALSLAFSPDGNWLAAGCFDGESRLTRVAPGPDGTREQLALRGLGCSATDVRFAHGGRWLVTGGDYRAARAWDMTLPNPGASGQRLVGHGKSVLSVAYAPDGDHVASASDDGSVRVWNIREFHPETDCRTLQGTGDPVRSVAYSRDGRWLSAAFAGGRVGIWPADASAGERPIFLGGQAGEPRVVHFSEDGSFVLVEANDDRSWLWDTRVFASRAALARTTAFALEAGRIYPVAARTALPGGWTDRADPTDVLWEFVVSQRAARLGALMSAKDAAVAFNAETSQHWSRIVPRLAPLRRFAVDTGTAASPAASFRRYSFPELRAIAFSRDGRFIATAGFDRAVRVWALDEQGGFGPDAPLLAELRGPMMAIREIAFSPDGMWIVAGANDASVWRWPLDRERICHVAALVGERNYTVREWEELEIDGEYVRVCPEFPVPTDDDARSREGGRRGSRHVVRLLGAGSRSGH